MYAYYIILLFCSYCITYYYLLLFKMAYLLVFNKKQKSTNLTRDRYIIVKPIHYTRPLRIKNNFELCKYIMQVYVNSQLKVHNIMYPLKIRKTTILANGNIFVYRNMRLYEMYSKIMLSRYNSTGAITYNLYPGIIYYILPCTRIILFTGCNSSDTDGRRRVWRVPRTVSRRTLPPLPSPLHPRHASVAFAAFSFAPPPPPPPRNLLRPPSRLWDRRPAAADNRNGTAAKVRRLCTNHRTSYVILVSSTSISLRTGLALVYYAKINYSCGTADDVDDAVWYTYALTWISGRFRGKTVEKLDKKMSFRLLQVGGIYRRVADCSDLFSFAQRPATYYSNVRTHIIYNAHIYISYLNFRFSIFT